MGSYNGGFQAKRNPIDRKLFMASNLFIPTLNRARRTEKTPHRVQRVGDEKMIRLKGKSGRWYGFDGPYSSPKELNVRPGVYAILCDNGSRYTILDIGESENVRERIENHDRRDCWERECKGGVIKIAVYYTPIGIESMRINVEKDLRGEYNPPCGER